MTVLFDVLIRNGTVIDGTGAPGFRADVGIDGERVVRVGHLADAAGALEIDAAGHLVAPGFIDAHTHDDRLLLSAPEMAPKVSQGVTTVIGGNCGVSLAPMPRPMKLPVTPPLDLLDEHGTWFRFPRFADYLSALADEPAATNCAMLVGHQTLRLATMNDPGRAADASEIGAMRSLVEEAMAAGAIGVSTGLFYGPSVAAPTEEVIQVCEPLGRYRGVYCTHMRDEGDHVMTSLEETFRIGREVGVKVVVSHHKLFGVKNHGRSVETLAFIERQMRLQPICLDCYPYAASSTILLPDRAALARRVTVTWSRALPEYGGMDLDTIAERMNTDRDEAIRRLQPAGAVYHSLDEADVRRILAFGPTMIGSDGLPHDQVPHPRLWGSFARVLGHYARSLELFPMETAVHKMTGLTARNFGLQDRGELREGAFADVTIFSADEIGDAATYEQPIAAARGIHSVLVNGSVVWRDGRTTGARPGRVLARSHPG
ncbi:MAG: amidohydrolase family protein [Lautropia sp.]